MMIVIINMMIGEVISDAATIGIFAFISVYISYKNRKHVLSWTIWELSIGLIIISISDMVSLYYIGNYYIDCLTFKFMAFGSLIAVLGLFHSVSIFPRKKLSYKLLPSIYLISAILIIFIFTTSNFIACDPSTGGKRCELWTIYLTFFYSIFILTAILILSSLKSKIKLVRTQAIYLSVGVLISVIYVGFAQVFPAFHNYFDYFSAVHALPIMGIFIIFSILRYHMFVYPVESEGRDGAKEIEIKMGEVNGIVNEHTAFRTFREIVKNEPGIIITIKPPNIIRERYLIEKTPIIWLTYFPSDYRNSVIPDRLHFEVMYSIINFVQRGGRIIMVQGAEYMIGELGRKYFVEFIEDIRALHENLTVIIAVNDRNVVEGFADHIIEEKSAIENPKVTVVKNPQNLCIGNAVVITSKSERKIKDICGEDIEYIRVWNNFDPERLVFEGINKIIEKKSKIVFIECMDYLISSVGEIKTYRFLKDVIDIIVYNSGVVYLSYTPRLIGSPFLMSLVEYSYD